MTEFPIAGLTAIWLTMAASLTAEASTGNPGAPVLLAPVFDNEDSPPPNLAQGPCVFGNDFDVNPGHEVQVTSLGAFDDGGNGLEANVLVAIYDRVSGRRIAGTAVTFKPPGTSYQLANQSRWQNIAPVTLGAGKYTVVAANYGPSGNASYPSGYSSIANPKDSPLRFNTLAGAVRPQGGRWLSQKEPWQELPERISGWTSVLDGRTYRKPLFATGTFGVRRDPATEIPRLTYIPPKVPHGPDQPSAVPDVTNQWINGAILLVLAVELLHRKNRGTGRGCVGTTNRSRLD